MRQTIKRGSKGDDVKALQKALGITDDGCFGAKTEAAVIDFQKSHGLTADGIVGAKTWAALGLTHSNAVADGIVYAPLQSCITKTPNRSIKYLAIHYTAGSRSKAGTAILMKKSWEATKRASADFGVDDRDMVQFNPDPRNYRCWSVGDKKNASSGGGRLYGIATNSNTISIELCSTLTQGTFAVPNHEGWRFTDAVINNAVKLAKILMKKYDIPIERVVRHYDITGKLCPGVVGWNNGNLYTLDGKATSRKNESDRWEEFKRRLT